MIKRGDQPSNNHDISSVNKSPCLSSGTYSRVPPSDSADDAPSKRVETVRPARCTPSHHVEEAVYRPGRLYAADIPVQRPECRRHDSPIATKRSLAGRRLGLVYQDPIRRLHQGTREHIQCTLARIEGCDPFDQSTTSIRTDSRVSTKVAVVSFLMILPQVHLRKPCYDFSFL